MYEKKYELKKLIKRYRIRKICEKKYELMKLIKRNRNRKIYKKRYMD